MVEALAPGGQKKKKEKPLYWSRLLVGAGVDVLAISGVLHQR